MDYALIAFLLLLVVGMIALMRYSSRDDAQSKGAAAQSRAEGEAQLLRALVDQYGFTKPLVHAWSRSPSGIAIDEVSLRIALFSGLVTPKPSVATTEVAPRTKNDLKVEVWDIQQVFGVDVVVNGRTTERVSRLSQAAAMAVGGLAFGEAGAIVGGLSSGTSTRATVTSAFLRLTVDDLSRPHRDVIFYAGPPVPLESFQATGELGLTHWKSVLGVALKRADARRASSGHGTDNPLGPA